MLVLQDRKFCGLVSFKQDTILNMFLSKYSSEFIVEMPLKMIIRYYKNYFFTVEKMSRFRGIVTL